MHQHIPVMVHSMCKHAQSLYKSSKFNDSHVVVDKFPSVNHHWGRSQPMWM